VFHPWLLWNTSKSAARTEKIMTSPITRFIAAAALLAAVSPAAWAQQNKKPDKAEREYERSLADRAKDEYRSYFKQPETPEEWWAAMRFEIDVGRYGLASVFLKGLLDSTRTDDKPLLAIEEREGILPFLELRLIRNWVDNPTLPKEVKDKLNRQARLQVEELIRRVSGAVQKHLANPDRMRKLINLFAGDNEDQTYALVELRKSGAAAVPYLIDAWLRTEDAGEQSDILWALRRLNRDAMPPVLAVLAADPTPGREAQQLPLLRTQLIDVMLKRADTRVIPYLWYLSASDKQPSAVRTRAREALAAFLDTAANRLPSAKEQITDAAERYYQHKVEFANPKAVTVWQWLGDRYVLPPAIVTASQAEEFHGLELARQALDLDPTYEPAQVLFLSLALEKGYERGGLQLPLSKGAPRVKELAETVNPELFLPVLERALKDHRIPIILAAVHALGEQGEAAAVRPTGTETPPLLVRALNYPDRRVQLAAANAILSIPATPAPPAATRVVDVLRRTLLVGNGPRALVAVGNARQAEQVARLVKQAGYEPVTATTGKEALQQLARAADIDVALIDASIPYPQLPYVLAQIRQGADTGYLPIIVMLPPKGLPIQREEQIRKLIANYRNVSLLKETFRPQTLKERFAQAIADAAGQPLTADERKEDAGLALLWLNRLARGEVRGYDVQPAAGAILEATESEELGPLAIQTAEYLPGTKVQQQLARVILNGPDRLKPAAALALARHMQAHGIAVPQAEAARLAEVYRTAKAGALRSSLARVMGSLHPDARVTGRRLEDYRPTLQPAPGQPGRLPPPKPDREE
jgi:CheY-like chemotaxis protein